MCTQMIFYVLLGDSLSEQINQSALDQASVRQQFLNQ